jgi:predicted CoA-binding protein
MSELERAIADFLALERVAVAGVSRDSRQPANLIFRKLSAGNRSVFAVNPNAASVEGETAYPSVAAIPGGVEGVVVVTTPAAALGVIEECAAAGVRQVWLHRSFGDGSVSPAAVERCRQLGLRVIPGVCPMMYAEPVDGGHKFMKLLIRVTGKLPQPA